jgi:hypothetical protein
MQFDILGTVIYKVYEGDDHKVDIEVKLMPDNYLISALQQEVARRNKPLALKAPIFYRK